MRKIIKERAGGKTSILMKISQQTKAKIVCRTSYEADRVYREALERGIRIEKPISYKDLLDGRKEEYTAGVLIDDADAFLEFAAGRKKVVAMAMDR